MVQFNREQYKNDPKASWSITVELIEFLKSYSERFEQRLTLLELGSGYSTQFLSNWYDIYSIENDRNFMKFDENITKYIYAPLKDKWYDISFLKVLSDIKYDVILIDGPIGDLSDGRIGFYKNIELFNTNSMMIFDDTNRPGEKNLFESVSKKLHDRRCEQFKRFSVIYEK